MSAVTVMEPDIVPEQTSSIENIQIHHRKPPWWSWVLLGLSVCSMSSGGTWFALLDDTPPFLKAAWRLQMTSLLQFFGFAWTLSRLYLTSRRSNESTSLLSSRRMGSIASSPSHRMIHTWIKYLPLMTINGIVLAIHFASWSWSIDHTSLTHSLLFVSAHPLVIVVWLWLLWAYTKVPTPDCIHCSLLTDYARVPSKYMTIGAIIGFGGAAIMVTLGTGASDKQVTVQGDMVAFLGAVAMAIYIGIGRQLRSTLQIPLWLYVFPVTFISAIVSSIFALIVEESVHLSGLDSRALFGWFGNEKRALLVTLLGGVSGVLGHTLANFSLKYINSLVVSVTLLFEPLVGSVIGWLFGKQDPPAPWTYGGGLVLLAGALLVTYGSAQWENTKRESQTLQLQAATNQDAENAKNEAQSLQVATNQDDENTKSKSPTLQVAINEYAEGTKREAHTLQVATNRDTEKHKKII